MNDWNSEQYTKFERERTQPSIDLIHRINIRPTTILDIGCGPGNSTNRLAKYFPDELDSLENYDLIFSNASLHCIPDHESLLPKLMSNLNDGGMLAVQMPLVQEAMFYKLLNRLISEGKWKKLSVIHNFHNRTPNETYDILSRVSNDITMWDTTYYHVVPSHDSVIEWYKGSGLRPYLEMLSPAEKSEFLSDLLAVIKREYPVQADDRVILKMPRLFFTAVK